MLSRALLGASILWVPLAFLFDGVTVLVLPLRLAGSATEIGLVSFVGLSIAAAAQPGAGWLSDRLRDRIDRPLFVAAAAVPAIGGLFALVGSAGLAAAVLAYGLVQAGAASVQAALQALIPERIPHAAQGRASGLKTAFDVGGATVAFVVLGAVLSSGDLFPAAAVVTVVLAAAVLLTIVLVPRHVAKAPGPAWQGTLPPGLVPLVAARFLFLLATYGVGRFLVLLVAERLGIAPERVADDAGWLLALFTLTTALAAIAFGWLADERSRRRLMTVGSVVAAAGIVTLVPETGLEGLIIGGLLMSVATAAFVSANWAAMTALVPGPQAGRLMGIANLGTALAAAAAGLFGPIIEGIGFAPALLLAAAASAAAIVPLTGWSEPATRPAEGIA